MMNVSPSLGPVAPALPQAQTTGPAASPEGAPEAKPFARELERAAQEAAPAPAGAPAASPAKPGPAATAGTPRAGGRAAVLKDLAAADARIALPPGTVPLRGAEPRPAADATVAADTAADSEEAPQGAATGAGDVASLLAGLLFAAPRTTPASTPAAGAANAANAANTAGATERGRPGPVDDIAAVAAPRRLGAEVQLGGTGEGAATPLAAAAAEPATPRLQAADNAAFALQALAAPAPTPLPAPTQPATGADPRIAAPVPSPEFAPALGAQVSLMVREGVQEARLQLHPAELGPITVKIQIDGSNAQVNIQAEHAFTRERLEQALPVLAGALQDNGLTLTGGGVFEQPRQQQPGDAPRARTGTGGTGGSGAEGDDDGNAATLPPPRRTAARGGLDVYA